MAKMGPGFDWTLPASGDLSSDQYKLMDASTAGQLRVATARGQRVEGVGLSKSTAAGISHKYRFFGITKVAAGDSSAMENAIQFGTPLISSSKGQAVPSTDNIGDFVIGHALEDLSSDSTGTITAMINLQGPASS